MSNLILMALSAIDVSLLDYADWISVGMALKEEGYPLETWDNWSKNDDRYEPGICETKWNSFNSSATPVRGGTIIRLAKEQGWEIPDTDTCLDYNDVITDYSNPQTVPTVQHTGLPTHELKTYLETLFQPDEIVGYVTNDTYQTPDGKWVPGKGTYNRTAGEILDDLKKHPTDLGAVIGDWKPEAGAWIRFNPLDGKGVKNENVTAFRYALVESDTIPVSEQEALFRKHQLPIAVLVSSGGKSIHAIVKVDAPNAEEYKNRVLFLYEFMEANGVTIDKQNKNPSRLSRLPGADRNGNHQALLATNIGRKTWNDWIKYINGEDDSLPAMVPLTEILRVPVPPPEELIQGILRRGHKMLVTGPSKAGKSFLLLELCISIAEGQKWLNFDCRKGKVLYVNLELDPSSLTDRIQQIYASMGILAPNTDNLIIWNLRGRARPLDKLLSELIRQARPFHFDAIVIDPIYKIISGDENNATAMGAFCNLFDRISTALGCAVIYCHHHSKGPQANKKSRDRGSGSGVFARDPDALLDIIEVDLPEDVKETSPGSAWKMESVLREFPSMSPVYFWFQYPLHKADADGTLAAAVAGGTSGRKKKSRKDKKELLDNAYAACKADGTVTVDAIAQYMGVSERTARTRLKEFPGCYSVEKGVVQEK